MPLVQHRESDVKAIEDRIREIADGLAEIRREMKELGQETIDMQSESILNHRVVPIEDWLFRLKHKTEKEFRKIRRDKEAFTAGQQYAAAKAEKAQKTPRKRRK